MQKKHQNISHLIVRYMQGKITAEEMQILTQWLETENRQEVMERLTNRKEILNKSFEYDSFPMNRAWRKLEKQMDEEKNYHWKKWLAYASVIFLPIAIALLVYVDSSKSIYSDLECTQITPGEKNAIIYFANGTKVNLKHEKDSSTFASNELLVTKRENVLQISDKNSDGVASRKMNKVVTPIGDEYQLILPDGTKVWLNADSYLEFPSSFSKKERRVIAKGELYFDVKSNKKWPFIVQTKDVELKVLGTEFNIRSYDDESEIISTLIEGSVEVRNSRDESLRLVPGKKAVFHKSDLSFSEENADLKTTTAWRFGRFAFENRRIEDILNDLSKWYEINVFYENSYVRNKRFSLDIPRYAQINEVLNLLSATGEINFTIKGKVVSVRE